jgi:uncharacterized phiE125 gp8 family phage protein
VGTSVVVRPTIEPVSLGEARAHLRVDSSDTDPTLAGYILAARQWCEAYTRRLFISQTWDCTFDYDWPCKINLPFAPISSVTQVVYIDETNTQQTLAATEYLVAGTADKPYIVPAYDVAWPTVLSVPETVRVRFVGGYGTSMGDVPEPIRMAILLTVELLYDRTPASKELLESARNSLLDPYKVV